MNIRRSTGVIAAAALTLALGACLDSPGPSSSVAARGIVVLHGFGALPGFVQTDSMTAGTRIPLPPEFDGARMRLVRDTALTASSGFGGDNRLYMADLAKGTMTSYEMPAGANSGGATLVAGFREARAAIAFRSLRTVGLLRIQQGTSAITQLEAGRCPYDVAMHLTALWVLDYNAACDTDYSLQGESRLIRILPTGLTRDTVFLPGVKFATSLLVAGNRAYVGSIGVTTYASDFTPTFVAPGSVSLVDLISGQYVGTQALPAGTSGASINIGLDGRIFVTAYLNTSYQTGVYALSPTTLEFTGVRAAGGQHLRLIGSDGQPVQCQAATGDRLGRIYCVINQGPSATTSMVVFSPDGTEIRRFTTGGTGAVDIAMR